jgi:DUF4097 and DUF4098 domain-containing protein YvlB
MAVTGACLRLALPALIVCSTPACDDLSAFDAGYVDTVEKRFTAAGQPSLTLSTFDGSINVNTWDRAEVMVRIEKRAVDKAGADRIQVTAEQRGDEILLRVEDSDHSGFNGFFNRRGARLLVTVPVHARIDATTGDGRVGVQAVQGDLRVRTGDGSIRIQGVRGTIDASSGDGSIEIDGAIDQLQAKSGDGHVRVRAASPIAASATWDISTGDGSVIVELPGSSGAQLDATTGDGRVRIDGLTLDGPIERKGRRSAHGRIGSGGGRIVIKSGDGSITVRAAT